MMSWRGVSSHQRDQRERDAERQEHLGQHQRARRRLNPTPISTSAGTMVTTAPQEHRHPPPKEAGHYDLPGIVPTQDEAMPDTSSATRTRSRRAPRRGVRARRDHAEVASSSTTAPGRNTAPRW